MEKFQGLDIVVNNAGIGILGVIEEYSLDDWRRMIQTVIDSVFYFSKFSIPHLKNSDSACIVNISSRLGVPELMLPRFVVPGALKAAVTSFTIGLAKELEESGVRANVFVPAPTDTDLLQATFDAATLRDMQEHGVLGTPEEVAKMVLGIILDEGRNGEIVFDPRIAP